MTVEALSDEAILRELEPVVERELERHLKTAKEWFPHEYVPWSEGRNYDGLLEGEAWAPEQSKVPSAVATALAVNLLTEDNLPSYHFEIAVLFGRDRAWGEWVHRWTAEEGRHGQAIRDYLLVTRACDPVALERERMVHMAQGFQNDNPGDAIASIAYVSFQELATRVSHRNVGKATGDPIGDKLFARIATDENLHMVFYRALLEASLELAPDRTMQAITQVVKKFQMPGYDLPGFQRKALEIAMAGIYDLRQHRDNVVMPVLNQWRVWDRDLGAEGEKARLELDAYLSEIDAAASRFTERREARLARQAARQG
ncbi:acyl-ACP desaturase [Sporichthya polymorpha]|uniref:acyl-ACP desaturase n=1 Tax=Sporichthya polymorpha TaxID=35751 RepID=UPI00035E31FB|nr:acyl-ACP desaturase [Sporichthya polymorpha]